MPQSREASENHPTRVYKYGLAIKGEFPKQAIDELYRANKLWNTLVAIHNQNWDNIEKARCDASPEYSTLKNELEKLENEIKNAYAERRKLRIETGSTKGNDAKSETNKKHIDELKKKRKHLWDKNKTLRKDADQHIDKKTITDNFNKKVNDACGVGQAQISSTTADEVKRNFKEARDRILKNPGSGRLQFHRFDGTGYWHYRFSYKDENGKTAYGKSLTELFIGNKNSDPPFIFESEDTNHKKPRIGLRAQLVGRKGETKIFQKFDMIYHRPVPDHAQIQNAKILRTRTGDKFRYDVVLTIRFPQPEVRKHPDGNAIGVDIGFRQDGDKLLVATISSLCGGITQEVYIPEKMKTAFSHIDDIKSELDQSASDLGNKLKPLFTSVCAIKNFDKDATSFENLEDEERARHYFLELCKSVISAPSNVTLSYEKAYKIARRLPYHEGILSEESVSLITNWWKGYSRRYRELHNLRAKQIRHRNDVYRQIAAELVRHGMLISVEKNILHKIAEVKDKDNALARKARENRVICAPYAFVSALENACKREAIPFKKVDPANTSKTCFDCGEINKSLKDEKEWRCSCGIAHDRDKNAARNIARKGLDQYKKTKIE